MLRSQWSSGNGGCPSHAPAMPCEPHYAWCRDTLFNSGADAFKIGTPRTKSSGVHEASLLALNPKTESQ